MPTWPPVGNASKNVGSVLSQGKTYRIYKIDDIEEWRMKIGGSVNSLRRGGGGIFFPLIAFFSSVSVG